MKKSILFFLILTCYACQQTPSTGNFGVPFENRGANDFTKALNEFNAGHDTTYLITGTIENVCQGQGCWLTFKTNEGEFLVNTKERFTMPKNSKGKKATAKGKFVKNEEGEVEFEPIGVIIE